MAECQRPQDVIETAFAARPSGSDRLVGADQEFVSVAHRVRHNQPLVVVRRLDGVDVGSGLENGLPHIRSQDGTIDRGGDRACAAGQAKAQSGRRDPGGPVKHVGEIGQHRAGFEARRHGDGKTQRTFCGASVRQHGEDQSLARHATPL